MVIVAVSRMLTLPPLLYNVPRSALREYVISPLLNENQDHTSIHTKNVVASAISGSVVGGAMGAYFRECDFPTT